MLDQGRCRPALKAHGTRILAQTTSMCGRELLGHHTTFPPKSTFPSAKRGVGLACPRMQDVLTVPGTGRHPLHPGQKVPPAALFSDRAETAETDIAAVLKAAMATIEVTISIRVPVCRSRSSRSL